MNHQTNEVGAVVTGAAGWLGKALVSALIHGIDGLSSLPRISGRIRVFILPGEDKTWFAKFGDKIEIHEGDIRDKTAVKKLFESTECAIFFIQQVSFILIKLKTFSL
ncbi:NAD-dependent epimerase/dehydratase family protein [Vibrio algarum]|uniref:NAD-dependent epimerase/dehydratase family protein n=1 Tax=Vibrio algarum TaxID=3020714 RepID=A0ABT4YLW4_9VIBR|nr:NAD-dependent epimerase/dehydratase family protein [Vibrio sp. KJ40-1]MDB1122425.1 NAD-dependent epimerase/dehydratase family protein [Vibrio sp. KJ40-1]